jgi:hypothetical protein
VERITEWRGSATASRRQAVAVLTSARGRNGEREKYPHRPVALIGEGERERGSRWIPQVSNGRRRCARIGDERHALESPTLGG